MQDYMDDRYSIIDCLKARDLVKTNRETGYVPVMLCRPGEIKRFYCIHDETEAASFDLDKRFMTKKFYYAFLVWNFAFASIRRKYSPFDFIKFQWKPVNVSFQQLACDEDTLSEVRDSMHREMRRLADAHIISVSEGCFLSGEAENLFSNDSYPYFYCREPEVTFVLERLTEGMDNRQIFDRKAFDHTSVSYDWEDIKEYFVDVSIPLLELCNGKNINCHTERDEALFSACRKLDLDGIKDALRDGANLFALNQDGESAAYACVVNESSLPYQARVEQRKRCIDFLLGKGLDINLYGFGSGCTPLECCWPNGDVELLEYLLNRGADPNINSEIEDIILDEPWYKQSALLYNIHEDLSIGGETPDFLEMQQMLQDQGAKMYRDGFDVETGIWSKYPDLEPWGDNPWAVREKSSSLP